MGFGRGALLWLLGIPIPVIILLALFWASLSQRVATMAATFLRAVNKERLSRISAVAKEAPREAAAILKGI
jgi:cytochrome c-type biogenesis protein CcmH/NrfF